MKNLAPVFFALAVLLVYPSSALATDCCEEHGYPGCDTWGIEDCVCAQDPFCCETEWDNFCVEEVEEYGCGSCDSGPSCGDGWCEGGETCGNCPADCGNCGGSGDCCEQQDGPGCGDAGIQNCVCAQDSYCCDTKWDGICATEVEEFGCGVCEGSGGYCPGYTGSSNCCKPDNSCDWDNDNICDCNGTCAWDGADCGGDGCGDGDCGVDEDCAICPEDCGSCGAGDCCQEQDGPGCGDVAIQACVCAKDSYCCDTKWDGICVEEVVDFSCGTCEGAAGYCPGYDGGNSCCKTDNPCDWNDDGFCDCDSTCTWDSVDCGGGAQCGDGQCEGDENCGNCAEDCGNCGGGGDCCEEQDGPGCGDAGIQACVCAEDAYCCNTKWDGICVTEVEEFDCGNCGGASENCPGYTGQSDCCKISDPCGWAEDDLCDCDGTCDWDASDCGGGGPDCGDGWCEGDETCANCPEDCGNCGGSGDCCDSQDGPGCDDAGIQACVCAEDAYCCDTKWDDICVGEVEELGCGVCEGSDDEYCPGYEGAGGCCKPDDPCGWGADNICDCDGTCGWDVADCGGDGGCGDAQCLAPEDCENCPEDCGFCPGTGDCCQEHDATGCDNQAVQNCVCAEDAYCCDTKWDGICVGEVESMDCGSCEGGGPECGDGECTGGEDCETCPEDCGACPGQGNCCETQDGPGCNDPTVQACVCAEDSFCCEFTWDQICVNEVEELECGNCGGGGCGDGKCDDEEDCLDCPEDCGQCAGESCCEPHDTPGCADGGVQACVCEQDAFCCDVEWDGICVNEVTSLDCGSCEGGPACGDGECQGGENCEVCPEDCGPCEGAGNCCEPQETPGCKNPDIQACVCALDAYCCETMWDDICVEEVEGENCGSCSGCTPQCNGKECGSDGCGGTCGQCADNESCQNSKCVPTECKPDCAGKQCGSDGCGGTCGECEPGKNCNNGKCAGGCQPDCAGMQCGDDGCGGSCGTCAPGFFCNDGHCQKECEPDCFGKKCGPDGCGGTCGQCPPNFFCTAEGHCDPQCQPNCAGKQCGTDGCGGLCGSCPFGQTCDNGHCQDENICNPDCGGKQCGDDGCGGTCGTCPPGDFCNLQGHCVTDCVPNCANKVCGSDGCGGSCGECGFSEQCVNGVCEITCASNCLGKECGDNGCGGSCGICGQDQACSPAGLCMDCVPDCEGRECGDDGCQGSCGTCLADEKCDNESGLCLAPGEEPPDYDAYGWGDTWEGGDAADPGVDNCKEGQRWLYGKCVDEDDEIEGDKSGGCSSTDAGGSAPTLLLLLLLLVALPARRRPKLN